MTIVDPTTTPAWSELTRIAGGFTPDLRAWLSDAGRVRQLSFGAGELHVDLSKNLVTTEVLDSLLDLAEQVGLEARRGAMIRGDRINVPENRSVAAPRPPHEEPQRTSGLRSALRPPAPAPAPGESRRGRVRTPSRSRRRGPG